MKTWLSTRHCILIRLKDLTAETYLRIGNNAGALLIVLPKEINSLQNSDLMVRYFGYISVFLFEVIHFSNRFIQ